MNSNATFVRKRRAHLPMKYLLRPINLMVWHNKRPITDELKQIDQAFNEYIEMPIKKS